MASGEEDEDEHDTELGDDSLEHGGRILSTSGVK
jgi:hypothetical protein